MFHRALSASLVLAAALLAGGPVLAEAARFAISIAGLPAGELTLSGGRNGATYEAGSTIRATGLLGALSRIRYEGVTTGQVARDGSLVPVRHKAQARSARSERTTEILFENGDPARVTVEPPRSRTIDPAEQAGSLDPVSAAFALLLEPDPETLCNSRVHLFDGSRRSRLEVGRAEKQNGALVCNGLYVRLSGDAHAVDQSEWGFRLFFQAKGEGVELQRIEAQTRFGLAVASRRS